MHRNDTRRVGIEDSFAPQLADKLLVKLTFKALCQAYTAKGVNGVRSIVEPYMTRLGAAQSEIDAVMLIILMRVSDHCLAPVVTNTGHYSVFMDES